MEKKLKELNYYNAEAIKEHYNMKARRGLNGIACSECNKELYDRHPGTDDGVIVPAKCWGLFQIKSDKPLRRHIYCKSCGWEGTRVCS